MTMSKERIKKLQALGHARPFTRRDFISQGFIDMVGISMIPSLVSAIPFSAFADNVNKCASGGTVTNDFIPFLVFDMAGGGALPANFLVGGKGGVTDLLPNYDLLGWNPKSDGLDTRFGLPAPGKNVGKIFQGMITAMSPGAQANLQLSSICHEAQSDSSGNTTSAIIDVTMAGYRGTTFATGLGTRPTNSGGNTGVPTVKVDVKPVNVTSVGDVLDAAGYASLPGAPTKEGLRSLAASAVDINMEQASRLSNYSNGQQLNDLVECGYKKNLDLLVAGSDIDPRNNATFQKIFNLSTATAPNSKDAIAATVIMNAINKVSGPGCLTLGDCDYHDGTSTSGDAKDLEMGTLIGRAIESAYQLKKPLFFQLITDGGCSNSKGTRKWQSDDNGKCMTIVGYFNPDKVPILKSAQIGAFTTGQSADRDTFVGRNTSIVSNAVLANYLRACGKMDLFQNIVPATTFPTQMIDQVMMFA